MACVKCLLISGIVDKRLGFDPDSPRMDHRNTVAIGVRIRTKDLKRYSL